MLQATATHIDKIMQTFITVFTELSARDVNFALSRYNRVVSGPTALAMMGVPTNGYDVSKLHLDMVVYQPTTSQTGYLKNHADSVAVKGGYVLLKDGCELRISIVPNKKVPEDLLAYPFSSIMFRVQSADAVMDDLLDDAVVQEAFKSLVVAPVFNPVTEDDSDMLLKTTTMAEKLSDGSLMTFGAHKGKRLIDIPAQYFLYIHDKGWVTDKAVEAYIIDNLDALKKEAGYKK